MWAPYGSGNSIGTRTSYKEDKSLDMNGDDHVKPEAAYWIDLVILDG